MTEPASKARLAFLGLGQMGTPMTHNLLRAGYAVAVRDPDEARVQALVAEGATAVDSPAAAARAAEIVLACLPSGDVVREVVEGADGLLTGCRAGQVFVDMTTNVPADSARLAAVLAGRGVEMLDAPISGGDTGAVEATLSIMVGGAAAIFERCLPVFRALGRHVAHMGPAVGAGGHAKLANQILVCLHLAAVAEAVAYAERAGLDLVALLPALQAGHANSTVLGVKAPKILARDFSTVGPTWMSYKDLTYIERATREMGFTLPLTEQVRSLYKQLMDEGRADTDQIVLLELYERMVGLGPDAG